mgnify:CR=1 FL=1
MATRTQLAALEFLLDLRPCAMHQNQADAQRGKQIAVVRQRLRTLTAGDLAAEGDHEGASAKRVNVRRRLAKPGNELPDRVVSGHFGKLRQIVEQETQPNVFLEF